MADQPFKSTDPLWWKSAVLYQIYPRSFADSNNDGIGDLPGVIEHLDHFAWLGIDGIWLSPITVSPNADWGYDVADYCNVDPSLGTIADVDRLVFEAASRNVRVLIDLVPNHTSGEHAWFKQARSSRDNPYRDYYVWQDPRPDGSFPNNWVSSFGGPTWTMDDDTGQWYLHNFLPGQPDLNWWNPKVRDEFDQILRFWFDRGISGFRIDVAHSIVKDALLRDNPPATEDDPFVMQMFGQRPFYNENQPEVHEVLRRWRKIGDSYDPPRVLVGETSVDKIEALVTFYGSDDDELHLAFNFPFIEAPFEAEAMSKIAALTTELLPPYAWPVWVGSNHDVSRFSTRWAEGDKRKIRLAQMMLLSMRGTPFLFEGDEIGLEDADPTEEQLRDPVGIRFWPYYKGRDPERSPMPWTAAENGGFTAPGVETWLPMTDPAVCNVADQRADPGSVLNYLRDLIIARRENPEFVLGTSSPVDAPSGCWAWRRGETFTVALNMSDSDSEIPGVTGNVLICTDTSRNGDAVSGTLSLAPWTGAIVKS
ncbi:MAG: alpha-amylase family glycosyl hydrolase [Acidimicrobiales bacterium]